MPYPYRDNRTTDDIRDNRTTDDIYQTIILVCGVFIVTAVVGLVTAVIGWLV
jgi:hypothetical protein